MNRRQAKKAYKKKYGYNPPKTEIRYHQKWYYGKVIKKSVVAMQSVYNWMVDALTVMFDKVKDTLERIRTMSEEEFEGIISQHPELSIKDIAVLRAMRRNEDE